MIRDKRFDLLRTRRWGRGRLAYLQGAGGGSPPSCLGHRQAVQVSSNEAGMKGVAGANIILDIHREAGNSSVLRIGSKQNGALSGSEDDGGRAQCLSSGQGLGGIVCLEYEAGFLLIHKNEIGSGDSLFLDPADDIKGFGPRITAVVNSITDGATSLARNVSGIQSGPTHRLGPDGGFGEIEYLRAEDFLVINGSSVKGGHRVAEFGSAIEIECFVAGAIRPAEGDRSKMAADRLNQVGIYSMGSQALDEPAAEFVLANTGHETDSRTKGGHSYSEVGA